MKLELSDALAAKPGPSYRAPGPHVLDKPLCSSLPDIWRAWGPQDLFIRLHYLLCGRTFPLSKYPGILWRLGRVVVVVGFGCCFGLVLVSVPDEKELFQDPTGCPPPDSPLQAIPSHPPDSPLQAVPSPHGQREICSVHGVGCACLSQCVNGGQRQPWLSCQSFPSTCPRQGLFCCFPLCIPGSQQASGNSVSTFLFPVVLELWTRMLPCLLLLGFWGFELRS